MDKDFVTTACFGFFDFPREVRDNILGHLFTTSTCQQWTSTYGVLHLSSDMWSSIKLLQHEYIQNFQFSTEAAEAFYRSSNFEIYIGDLASFFSYKQHPTNYREASFSDKQSLLKDFDMQPFVNSVRIRPYGGWHHIPIDGLRELLNYPHLKQVIIATVRPVWSLGDMAEAQDLIKRAEEDVRKGA